METVSQGSPSPGHQTCGLSSGLKLGPSVFSTLLCSCMLSVCPLSHRWSTSARLPACVLRMPWKETSPSPKPSYPPDRPCWRTPPTLRYIPLPPLPFIYLRQKNTPQGTSCCSPNIRSSGAGASSGFTHTNFSFLISPQLITSRPRSVISSHTSSLLPLLQCNFIS